MGLTRTAQACRSDAPIVGVKFAIRSAGDGVKKRGHRGEREVSRKTIARGMPGRSGVTVVTMLVCFFHCMRGRGRIARPAFPAPSIFSGRNGSCKTSGISCPGMRIYVGCHCEEQSEAIHSQSNGDNGLLRRGACHRACIRATRWLLAMTVLVRQKAPDQRQKEN